jgi:hypothetical protein
MRVGDSAGSLQVVGTHDMKMPVSVLAGLFICSHDENLVEEVRVSNVRLQHK